MLRICDMIYNAKNIVKQNNDDFTIILISIGSRINSVLELSMGIMKTQ